MADDATENPEIQEPPVEENENNQDVIPATDETPQTEEKIEINENVDEETKDEIVENQSNNPTAQENAEEEQKSCESPPGEQEEVI